MALAAGTRLGPYELIAPIGAGGMGEVYRTTDTRLHREVAIKVSAERFSERFEREARVIAALNHPNICTLYDVGHNYLVMELVEGPTLAERIKEGAIPLVEALAIARQITDALDAAHEKGIVHRDLKPGNIKLKPDGTVKVLDFGLAKVGGTPTAKGEASPTISMARGRRQDAHPLQGGRPAGLGRLAARLAGCASMIQITAQMRVLVAIEPVDGRKGIDSLARLCQEKLAEDPFSGCVFVFRSRRGTAIRLLSYDLC